MRDYSLRVYLLAKIKIKIKYVHLTFLLIYNSTIQMIFCYIINHFPKNQLNLELIDITR